MSEPRQLRLLVQGDEETDAAELEALTRQLRAELLELDVDAVDLAVTGPAPEGSKADVAVAWGALLVTLAGSSGVLPHLLESLRLWAGRHGRHSVTLELDGAKLQVSDVSTAEQRRLVGAWLQAVAAR